MYTYSYISSLENEIGPIFDPNKNDAAEKRERYVVIEEIGMRNDQPWTMTYNEANKNMYNTHPYKRDVIGTKEIIANIPQSEIMDYYKTWYTPDNITTIIVGDVCADDYLDLLIKEFQFKNTKKAQKPILEEIKPLENPVEVVKKSDVTTGYCIMGFNTAKASNVKQTLLVEMISIILGESTSSRMYQNLIENVPKSIFNCIETSQYRFKDGNTFFIEANFEPDKKDEAIDLIKNEIQLLQKEGINDNELTMAKKKLKTRFAESVETVSEIGESIGYYMTVCGGIEQAKEYGHSFGQDMRSLFLPEEGCMMSALDYSQIEYLLLGHYAVGQQAEWFREQANAGVDFHTVAMQATGIPSRQVVKTFNYGVIYGMGWYKAMLKNYTLFEKLAAEHNEDIETFTKDTYNNYHARLPVIRDTMKFVQNLAKMQGYVMTIGGRYQHKPKAIFVPVKKYNPEQAAEPIKVNSTINRLR